MKVAHNLIFLLATASSSSSTKKFAYGEFRTDDEMNELFDELDSIHSEFMKPVSADQVYLNGFQKHLIEEYVSPYEAVGRIQDGKGFTTHIIEYISNRRGKKIPRVHQQYIRDMMFEGYDIMSGMDKEGLVSVLLGKLQECELSNAVVDYVMIWFRKN